MRKIFSFGFVSMLFLAAALMLAGVSVNAQTVKWVDQTSGNDANDGNSELTAYASLQWAIDQSSSGTDATTRSIIHVKDGIYGIAGQASQCEYNSPVAILISGLDYLISTGSHRR